MRSPPAGIEPLYTGASHAGHVAAVATILAPPPADALGHATVDLRPHAARAPAEQLAAGVRALVAQLDLSESVAIVIPVGPRILIEIAKLRAMRRLAARVGELARAAGKRAPSPTLHADSSSGGAAGADVGDQLIAQTAEVFAAVVGGADSIVPHGARADADAEGGRLADNVVHLALHEAHLARVADPAAGSFALETLTEDLCRAAWQLVQDGVEP